ncbi:MAG TPA: regulatory iron-sulfur-containing complex subunit RicT [Longimicrobiaceae bacterium]|jgi:cell fate regulator YaaT (PSP1 superfamily)|nr:regulatory iron-sulfur-containing complex subunit RicT [Longimicrobiaceae bacterium]
MGLALPVVQPLAPPGALHLVEVAFKGNRRDFFTTDDATLRAGEYVIVEAEKGEDLGRIRSAGGVARSKCGSDVGDAARVVRRAEPDEVAQLHVNRVDEERVRRGARELVEKHNLVMKVTETEWQWDKNRLIIYFTAERRVDFRQLVRDLARTFRTRIELKQIGVRDEAALLGGVGRCGRELCCATWLREIKPISLQLAKDQNLSLNPAQISGTCGRLMCCLTYEHDAYLQARKRFPREGRLIRTARGQEKVIGIDIWRNQVTLLDEQRQRRIVDLTELRAEIATAAPAASANGGGRETAPATAARAAAEEVVTEASAAATDGDGTARAKQRPRRPRRPRNDPSRRRG